MLELIKASPALRDLTPSTSTARCPEERLHQVERFNGGEGKLFLISLRAGGTGLNLTGADTVIHFDPWWNPAVEEQATDRAYRIARKTSSRCSSCIPGIRLRKRSWPCSKKSSS
jgi:SNF2 family DNA or RNA helicase